MAVPQGRDTLYLAHASGAKIGINRDHDPYFTAESVVMLPRPHIYGHNHQWL